MIVLSNCSFKMSSPLKSVTLLLWDCALFECKSQSFNFSSFVECGISQRATWMAVAFYEWALGCTPSACSFIKCKGITGNACTRDGERRCPRFPRPPAADVCWEMRRILIAEGDAVRRWGGSHSVWRNSAADTSHKKWGVAGDELSSLASTLKSSDYY